MARYSEEEIAAEEERIGRRLPDALRQRYLDGVEEMVVLTDPDGEWDEFEVLGPRTTDTDTKGRSYPTEGMHQETQTVREVDDGFLPDDVVVAWGHAANGDLAVVLEDGSLAWWRLAGGETVPAEVDWDPEFEED